MLKGQIIKAISSFYYVDTDTGVYECKARGIFKKSKNNILVGDNVSITILDEDEKKGVVEKIEKRKSELIRPPIANVDQAMIMFAIKQPDIHLSLLDRFLVLAEREGLDIVIVISKIDLDVENKFENLKEIYKNCGYKIIPISSLTGFNIDAIREELKDKVTVFAGPSGVGKSSILNAVDTNFILKTGSVSEKIKRGRHTTRHVELMKLESGGVVADTPGFSSLSVEDIEEEELKEYFIEFYKYNDCKFGNKCIHLNEPNCSVKNAVEEGLISKVRYESYLQLLGEIKEAKLRKW
ncbi:MAG: ribosome small subunit-dependent GTPase A [Clostridioides sp.]|jgi:ribosome biogenesis GTPase|nr:ribosome small subunit-dependent GTPase A [Clostridioides sp.]